MYETDSPGAAAGSAGATPAVDAALEPVLACETIEVDGRAVVTLRGELDLASSPDLLRQVQLVMQRPVRAVAIDLAGLTFIDSSGLGALCRIHQETQEQNIALALDRVPEHARRVLQITGLTELFEIR